MKIESIKICSYKNINEVEINFNHHINALIGFNNYGKSNLLNGIEFGFRFIKSSMEQRKLLIKDIKKIPLSNTLKERPFEFCISFIHNSKSYTYLYSFIWNSDEILSEQLVEGSKVIHYRNSSTQVVPAMSLLIDKQNSSLADLYDELKNANTYGLGAISDITTDIKLFDDSEISFAEALYGLSQNTTLFELLKQAYIALLPDINDLIVEREGDSIRVLVNQKHIEELTDFNMLSMGSRRILALLYMVLKSQDYKIKFLFLEEIEACLHPRLIPMLLMSLKKLSKETKIIVTSHSPYLIQYLPLSSIYLSMPNQNGLAGFKTIAIEKQDKLIKQANELELSLGVFLFDLLIESYYDEHILSEWL